MDLSETDYCFVDKSFEDKDCHFVNEESDSEFCFIEDQADEEDFCIIEKQESLTKPSVENSSFKEESEDEFNQFMRKLLTKDYIADSKNLSCDEEESKDYKFNQFMKKSLTKDFIDDIKNLSSDEEESEDEFNPFMRSWTKDIIAVIKNLSSDEEESEDEFMREIPIHRKKLLDIFKMKASNKETIECIKGYIKRKVRDPIFIYALSISIIESLMTASPDNSKLTMGKSVFNDLKERLSILKKFVDNDDEVLGLNVIFGIQQLSFENGHPEGFTELCFNAIYEVEIVHEGVFEEWEINEDPKFQLGKDACLSSASIFLNFIKDDESCNYYMLRGF